MTDPEIELIGKLIAAVEFGKAHKLDARTWLRVLDYTQSLIGAECGARPSTSPPNISEVRKRAWITRRQKYGQRGHHSSYVTLSKDKIDG